MNFDELYNFLKELDQEEKALEAYHKNKDNKSIEENVQKLYSLKKSGEEWVLSSDVLMKPEDNFAIHRHKRFARFSEHKHDYLEFIYVFSGQLQQKINGKVVNIKEGDLCLLDLNVTHSIEPSSENDVAINIVMKEQFFNNIFMGLLSDNNLIMDFLVKAIYHKKEFKQYLIFNCLSNEQVKWVVSKLLCEYYDNTPGKNTAIYAYILLLFTEILRTYKNNMGKDSEERLNKTIASEIKNYLIENFNKADLKNTAEHFHFHPDYLSKLIKNSTGQSFTALLQEIKLREASLLLQNTDMPVEEILYRTGYTNMSHFYRLFKMKYNVTPIEYRKNRNSAMKK
jgi:AraC family transcriptional regulator, dual regulator of chb operon